MRYLAVAGAVAIGLLALGGNMQEQKQTSGGSAERGKYIVERVAMCIQCHTPRDGEGNLLLSQLLHGAPMPVRSPFSTSTWALAAPRIAGMPGYTDEQGIRLLTEGITRRGTPPQPPMPPFRMNEQDARDVVKFLKSLP